MIPQSKQEIHPELHHSTKGVNQNKILKGIENDTDKSLCDESGDGAGKR